MKPLTVLSLLVSLAAPAPAEPRVDVHGDPLPDGAVARFGTVRYRAGWPGDLPAWAVSPDSKTVAVNSWYYTTLWDVDTGVPRARLKVGFHDPMESLAPSLAFSPDGKYFVRGEGGELHIWDAATGRERFAIGLQNGGGSPGFLPGTSRFLVTAGGYPAEVYDAETGRRVAKREVETFAWMPSTTGKYLLGHADDRMLLLDAGSGRVCTRFPDMSSRPRTSYQFSPDGCRLYAITSDGRLSTFDTTSGKQLEHLPPPAGWDGRSDNRIGLALSPDGTVAYLSTTSDRPRRRDLKAGKWLDPLPIDDARCVLPLPDGKRLLFLGRDGLLRRFDLTTRTEIPAPDGFEGRVIVAASPAGRRVAGLVTTNRVVLFDQTGTPVWSVLRLDLETLHWSPDGRHLAGQGEREIVVRDPATGKLTFSVTAGEDTDPFGQGVAFPPGRDRVLVTSAGGEYLTEFDLRTGRRGPQKRWDTSGHVALSPDGRNAAVDGDKTIHVVHLSSGAVGKVMKPEDGDGVPLVLLPKPRYTADGMYLVTSEGEGTIVLRDPSTGEQIQQVATGQKGFGWEYAVGPGALWLVLGGEDGYLSLWDIPSGKRLRRWEGHADRITSVQFAGAGRLLTGSDDLTAHLWELRPNGPFTKPLWEALSGADAEEAYRAVWAAAGDPEAPGLLRSKVAPVRAAPAAQVKQWLADLGADRFAMREAATKELRALGRLVEPHLRAARAAAGSEEVVTRLDGLLAQMPRGRTAEELTQARAVAAMELDGGPAARKVLAE